MNKNSKKIKGFPKKLLALMLCCFCLLATMPISAVALETEETPITEESVLEQQAENDSDITETVTKTESEAKDGTEVETEIEAETEAEIEVEAETEPEAESETVAVTAAVIEAGSNPDAESKADVEIEVEVETATESENEAAAENVAEIAVLTVAGLEDEAKTTIETMAVAEIEVDAVINDGTVANDESKMVAVDEMEASSETETEVTSEASSKTETEMTSEEASEAETEVTSEETSEAETEVTSEEASEAETEVTSEEASEAETVVTREAESENETEINPADALFERLMAYETYDELTIAMENLTDEEYALIAQFTYEQNTALEVRVNEMSGYEVATLEEQSEEIEPDPAFLWVTKTFVGIDETPSRFSISVGEDTYMAQEAESTTNDGGSIVLKWKILVAASASYQLKESGAEVDNYTLAAAPFGILTEEGVNVSVDASRVTMTWKKDINECSNQVFSLSSDHVFIIAAKSNVIVLSGAPLGATARAAIINEIKTFSGDFKHGDGSTVFFYQISQYLGQTITIDGTSVTVSEDGATATIGATREWTKVKNYQYGYEAAQSDINITNTYKPKVCDLTISKNVSGNMGDRNKEFSFAATLSGEGYSFDGVNWSMDGGDVQSITAIDNSFGFTLKHGQSITFSGLPVGATFTVTENITGTEYVTTVDGGSGTSKTITLAETNANIVFENIKDVTVDTGILLDTLPYILILGVVAFGAVLLTQKRRDRDDD